MGEKRASEGTLRVPRGAFSSDAFGDWTVARHLGLEAFAHFLCAWTGRGRWMAFAARFRYEQRIIW
jgi:hypothetical protein